MCLQCTVEAENLGLVLPDWHLMRSTKDHPRWPIGHWGLVRSNDPDFVWSSEPTPDPLHGVPDDQWEEWFAANAGTAAYERTMSREPADFSAAFVCEPSVGWDLVRACITLGYDPEESGDFRQWLFSWIGIRIRDGFLEEPQPGTAGEDGTPATEAATTTRTH